MKTKKNIIIYVRTYINDNNFSKTTNSTEVKNTRS